MVYEAADVVAQTDLVRQIAGGDPAAGLDPAAALRIVFRLIERDQLALVPPLGSAGSRKEAGDPVADEAVDEGRKACPFGVVVGRRRQRSAASSCS